MLGENSPISHLSDLDLPHHISIPGTQQHITQRPVPPQSRQGSEQLARVVVPRVCGVRGAGGAAADPLGRLVEGGLRCAAD